MFFLYIALKTHSKCDRLASVVYDLVVTGFRTTMFISIKKIYQHEDKITEKLIGACCICCH